MPDDLVPRLEAYIRARDPQGAVAVENNETVIKFTQLGAPQQVKISPDSQNAMTIAYSVHLPGAKERWFIESKDVWFPDHSGCKRLKFAPLDGRYKMYATEPDFFAEVFGSHDLPELLLQLPEGDHVKASLQDGALKLAWTLHSKPGAADRDNILLSAADVMVRLGVQCFKSVQVARLSRGEQTKL